MRVVCVFAPSGVNFTDFPLLPSHPQPCSFSPTTPVPAPQEKEPYAKKAEKDKARYEKVRLGSGKRWR